MSAPKSPHGSVAMLTGGEHAAREQQFNLGHAVELLASQARDAGTACVTRKLDSLDMQQRWLRVEYLADLIGRHVADLARGLEKIEGATASIGRSPL